MPKYYREIYYIIYYKVWGIIHSTSILVNSTVHQTIMKET